MNNTKIRMSITIATAILLCLTILINTGIDRTDFIFLTIIAISVSIILVECIHYSRVAKKKANHMIIDEKNETAIMLKRSKESASLLSYETVHYMNYQNHAAKLVYTGATVGGIHTGGFHTTDAYTSESAGKSSNKAHVFVRDEGDHIVEIKKIKLTPELLAEAKKNERISKFIVEDYISLRNDNEETNLTKIEQDVLSQAIKTNDTAMQYNITQRAFIAQFLSMYDVRNIIEWVAGETSTNQSNSAYNYDFNKFKESLITGLIIFALLIWLILLCFT